MNPLQQLLTKLQNSNVGLILKKQAQKRIRERGADIGGYAPLWADSARLNVGTKKKPKFIDHYRKGGVPLYDTGELFRSLTAKTEIIADGIRLILIGSAIAVAQSKGFRIIGAVTIPFTRRAVRGDPKGARENLRVRNDVTVPARPIFAMPETAKKELVRAIARAMGAR
jgi:phage gpG-like protein